MSSIPGADCFAQRAHALGITHDVLVGRFTQDLVGAIGARSDDHLQPRVALRDQRLRRCDKSRS
jgi:hypothetical protein